MEQRLIDANALKYTCIECPEHISFSDFGEITERFLQAIDEQPTVYDEPAARRLDCEHCYARGGVTSNSIELLEEWQERLFLHSWRIALRENCKPDDMPMRDVYGCSDWTEETKIARIDIVDPKCIEERIVEFDFEKTLVHELLHLKFSLLSDNAEGMQARYVHQLIDEMARSLVDAKRCCTDGEREKREC